MQGPDKRLVFALVAAAVLSFLLGILFTETVRAVPCEGEGLVCNIDQAIGAYAVAILAVLGPCIFGVTLLVARNRTALAGAALVLLMPLVAFFAIVTIETWRLCRLRCLRRLAEIPGDVRATRAGGARAVVYPACRGHA